jgi:HEAT repeat protein
MPEVRLFIARACAIVLIALSSAFAEGPATLPEAVKGLRSPNIEFRGACEKFVLKSGLSAVRDVVVAASSDRGRLAAERVLAKMGRPAVRELLRLLDDQEARVQAGSLLYLLVGQKDGDLIPALLDCIRSKPFSKNDCGTTLVKVMSSGGGKHLPALVDLLKNDDAEVRAYAATCLGRLERKAAVTALTGALGDSSDMVRLTAAAALGRLGRQAKDALPVLQQMTAGDRNEAVRRQAKEAVEQING